MPRFCGSAGAAPGGDADDLAQGTVQPHAAHEVPVARLGHCHALVAAQRGACQRDAASAAASAGLQARPRQASRRVRRAQPACTVGCAQAGRCARQAGGMAGRLVPLRQAPASAAAAGDGAPRWSQQAGKPASPAVRCCCQPSRCSPHLGLHQVVLGGLGPDKHHLVADAGVDVGQPLAVHPPHTDDCMPRECISGM